MLTPGNDGGAPRKERPSAARVFNPRGRGDLDRGEATHYALNLENAANGMISKGLEPRLPSLSKHLLISAALVLAYTQRRSRVDAPNSRTDWGCAHRVQKAHQRHTQGPAVRMGMIAIEMVHRGAKAYQANSEVRSTTSNS